MPPNQSVDSCGLTLLMGRLLFPRFGVPTARREQTSARPASLQTVRRLPNTQKAAR